MKKEIKIYKGMYEEGQLGRWCINKKLAIEESLKEIFSKDFQKYERDYVEFLQDIYKDHLEDAEEEISFKQFCEEMLEEGDAYDALYIEDDILIIEI